MARQNDVRLYGFVGDLPQVVKTIEGKYVRGFFHLVTIRSARYSGEGLKGKDAIRYEFPIIMSNDETIISKMEKLKKNDIVEIKGVFTVRKLKKRTKCKSCEADNAVDGNIYFVTPIFLAKRNKEEFTEKQAAAEVIENREISNSITITGNLCGEVNYYHNETSHVQTSVYQIATDRKFFIKSDDTTTRTDFPIIRSFGKNAKQDSICLKTGSMVLIDGYLQSREFQRKTSCCICHKDYEWKDNIIELVPYATEYLSNYIDPEEAEKDKETVILEKAEKLKETAFA